MSTISTYILEFLKEHHRVQILDFGTFTMKNSAAKVVEENNNILPPAKEINLLIDASTSNDGFAEYIASKDGLMYHEAMSFLRKSADQWLTEAKDNGQYIIEGLGILSFQEDTYAFQGERLTVSSPDFFGLEEIDLEELKGSETPIYKEPVEKDSFGKVILWTFLIAIPVAGIIYLAITQKDKLIGKETVVVKTATHRIPTPTPTPEVDSLKKNRTVMTKADSIFGTTKKNPQ